MKQGRNQMELCEKCRALPDRWEKLDELAEAREAKVAAGEIGPEDRGWVFLTGDPCPDCGSTEHRYYFGYGRFDFDPLATDFEPDPERKAEPIQIIKTQ